MAGMQAPTGTQVTSGGNAPSPTSAPATSGADSADALKAKVTTLEQGNTELRRKVTELSEVVRQGDKQWVEALAKLPNGQQVLAQLEGRSAPQSGAGVDELIEKALTEGDSASLKAVLQSSIADAVRQIEQKLQPQLQRLSATALDGTVRSFLAERGASDLAKEGSPFMTWQVEELDRHPELRAVLGHNPTFGLELLWDRYAKSHGIPTSDVSEHRQASLEERGHPTAVKVTLPTREDGRSHSFEDIAKHFRRTGVIGRNPPPDDI